MLACLRVVWEWRSAAVRKRLGGVGFSIAGREEEGACQMAEDSKGHKDPKQVASDLVFAANAEFRRRSEATKDLPVAVFGNC